MILIDANLLIYAVNSDAPQHVDARRWLENTLSSQIVGLPWISLLAFLRITTRPRVFPNPISADEALDYVDSWLGMPNVSLVGPDEGHWPIFEMLLRSCGTAGNLTSDAHIAALALRNGYRIYSADHDFKRFAGVVHINPLQASK